MDLVGGVRSAPRHWIGDYDPGGAAMQLAAPRGLTEK